MARVVYRDENYQTTYREINAQNPVITIGRNQDNAIVVSSKALSRYHAKILFQNGRYVLVDLNSSNGCYVNDKRISTQEISPGDKIRCGTVPFDFVEDHAPAATAPQGIAFSQSIQNPAQQDLNAPVLSGMGDPRNFGARPISATNTYRPTMLNQPSFEEDMARRLMDKQPQIQAQTTGSFGPPPPQTIDVAALAPQTFDPRSSSLRPQQQINESLPPSAGSNYVQNPNERAQNLAHQAPQSFDPRVSGYSYHPSQVPAPTQAPSLSPQTHGLPVDRASVAPNSFDPRQSGFSPQQVGGFPEAQSMEPTQSEHYDKTFSNKGEHIREQHPQETPVSQSSSQHSKAQIYEGNQEEIFSEPAQEREKTSAQTHPRQRAGRYVSSRPDWPSQRSTQNQQVIKTSTSPTQSRVGASPRLGRSSQEAVGTLSSQKQQVSRTYTSSRAVGRQAEIKSSPKNQRLEEIENPNAPVIEQESPEELISSNEQAEVLSSTEAEKAKVSESKPLQAEGDYSNLQNIIDALTSEKDELQEALRSQGEVLLSMKELGSSQAEQLQEYAEKLKKKNLSLEENKEQIATQTQKIESLSEELSSLNQRIETLETSLQESQEKGETLEKKNVELSAKLEAEILLHKSSEEEIVNLSAEIESKKRKISDIHESHQASLRFFTLWKDRFENILRYAESLEEFVDGPRGAKLSPTELEQIRSLKEVVIYCIDDIKATPFE